MPGEYESEDGGTDHHLMEISSIFKLDYPLLPPN